MGLKQLVPHAVRRQISAQVARVQAARNLQLSRFSKIDSSNIVSNADMRIGEIRQFCKLQDEG